MRSKLLRLSLLTLFVALASLPVHAQRATEWQVQSMATLGGDRFIGGGLGIAHRTNGRMRVGFVLSGGDLEGSLAIRPELVGSFHFVPYKRQGMAPYVGGGVAVVVTDRETREFIVALVGVESRPGRSVGWFAEAGLGGGARLMVGIRYRKRRSRAR